MFFRKNRIIDYSLVLVFSENKESLASNGLKWHPINEKYQLAYYIIDYLQIYNERKKLENKFKSLFFKSISSVDPDSYADRLL